ncbi:serine carboxypeptidase-like [Cynara cardunculus var. scolymus]|uniref:serine carboxypeptidase-like n=1 Tax=Cynara cardunculus var. scolymus TaxID=59895 RepID=UPI000D62D5FE|nr:serine carboxypeptidase-like [Cynara cardunculus var. scolymus]
MASILSLFLSFLFLISSSTATTNPSSHSSLHFSPSLRKTGHQLIKDLNLHPNLEVNILKPFTNSSDAEFKVFESGVVEKRLSFQVLGESGATVQDLAQRAGYFHLKHTIDARMFYFFFESRKAKADPVVIWLTGGPGCSSELALFYENGPFKITNNLSLVWNDYGWDKVSNIIFVDQPTGTGFSYSSSDQDIRSDETGVSNDLYNFLQAFFKAHPDYVNNDFYITGESYAGHYIPALAARINQGNKNKEGIPINLKGFGIGNGLTDPGIQYQAYTDYALANNIISKSDYNQINQKIPSCERAIKQCGTTGTFTCQMALNSCQQIFEDILSITDNINYYDIRKKCEGTLCYDFSNLEHFLVQSSVKTALGVPEKIEFVSCSDRVYQAMINDWMRNLEVGIPALLEQNIQLLVYAGEYDLICNWLGNSRWVHAMSWSGQKDFIAASDVPFLVDGKEAGILKNHGPLTFIKVHDAGHMVPMDQPRASLQMLELWTTGKLTPPKKGAISPL